MDTYRTDDETAEVIKKWWQDNGRAVVMGVVIGLAVVVGVRYWVQYNKTQSQTASVLYAQITKALATNSAETVLSTGQSLLKDYAATAYAPMAAMAMARVETDAGKTDQAKDHLQWVVANADDGLQHAARLRLARLLLNDDKLQEAADLLAGIKAPGYNAEYEELRADIALAKGNTAQARELYRLALAGANGAKREFLQMKFDNIAVAREAAASN